LVHTQHHFIRRLRNSRGPFVRRSRNILGFRIPNVDSIEEPCSYRPKGCADLFGFTLGQRTNVALYWPCWLFNRSAFDVVGVEPTNSTDCGEELLRVGRPSTPAGLNAPPVVNIVSTPANIRAREPEHGAEGGPPQAAQIFNKGKMPLPHAILSTLSACQHERQYGRSWFAPETPMVRFPQSSRIRERI
jgi:hypothetical protein